jgi:transcriptional regulator with XRE-family HTH domain
MSDQTTVGQRIRDERKWLGATRAHLAQAARLTEADVADFEDDTRDPDPLQTARLAQALRLDSPDRLRGAPLAPLDRPGIMCGKPTAEDHYRVRRFAELLRNSGPPPGGETP